MNGKKNLKRKTRDDSSIADATDLMAKLQPAYALPESTTPGEDLAKRLLRIRKLIDVVNKIDDDVAENPPDPWGSYRDPFSGRTIAFSGRVAQTNIDGATTRLNRLLNETIELKRSQASMIKTTMKPKTGEYCGDGNCYIQVVNIGLGDCTTIATPRGLRIMIDMGSDSMTDVKLDWNTAPPSQSSVLDKTVLPLLLDTIKRDIFLGTDNQIQILILTHTDGDHHNKLRKLGAKIKFTRVYYSGDAIARYGNSSAFIKKQTASLAGIKRVDVRPENGIPFITRTINGITPPTLAKSNNPNNADSEYVDLTTGAIVLYEEDNGFKISILASNITGVNFPTGQKNTTKWVSNDADIKTDQKDKPFKLNATEPNKRSQVILVEFNGQKAIITGDATAVTEYFMVTQAGYASVLQNVDLYRLPHHGSLTSSSARMIAKLTNVKEVVGSCSGKFTVAHRLPQQGIMNLYVSPELDANHLIWAFDTDVGSGAKSQNTFNKKTYATGSNGTRIYKFAKP